MHQPDNIFILACVHFIVWLAVLTLIGGTLAINYCLLCIHSLHFLYFVGYTHNQWRAIAHEKKVPEKVFASPTIRELQLAHIFRDLASKLNHLKEMRDVSMSHAFTMHIA